MRLGTFSAMDLGLVHETRCPHTLTFGQLGLLGALEVVLGWLHGHLGRTLQRRDGDSRAAPAPETTLTIVLLAALFCLVSVFTTS